MDFGGIRIKSLVLIDPLTGGEPDVILYHYPYPGELVYTDYTNTETVDYGGFSDLILFSKAKSKGLAFLNLGNHGVYYDYVEEEFVGKGKKTYLFLNPRRLALSTPASSYKFWLNGLPLGVATYDNAGNLRSLTRNRYCADVDVSDYFKLHPNGKNIYPSGSWFPSNNNHTKYLSTKPQIKAYEYYMDFNDLASYYYNEQDDVYLGWHAGWYSFNPYNDVFLPNIAPRTNAASPEDQRWELVYGGKVLLKSQEEFRIEGNDPLLSGPCIGHFVADLGTPFNKVEYFYDNVAESTAPTRISTTDSQGDVLTTVIRRVGDMNVGGVLADMKAQNIWSPVVKVQNLRNDNLLGEVVNVYGSAQHNGKTYFGLVQEKSYFPASSVPISSFPATDSNLFTYGEPNYRTEKEISYTFDNGNYVPVSITEKGNIMSLCYDFTLNVPILKAIGYSNDYVSAASSCYHSLSVKNFDLLTLYKNDFFESFLYVNDFIAYLEQEDFSNMPLPGHILGHLLTYLPGYLESEAFQTIKTVIGSIATRFQDIDYASFEEHLNHFIDNYDEWESDFTFYWENTNFHQTYGNGHIYIIIYTLLTDGLPESIYTYYRENEHIDYYRGGEDMLLHISQASGSGAKLYIVSRYYLHSIGYIVTHSGGTSTGAILLSKPYWNLQVLDIDLSAFSGVTSIKVNTVSTKDIAYIALVPADSEFEAVSYNADRSVFCRFDHTGIMERYEYDGAGRVVRIFDGNGNLLKENTYNRPLQ